jgi:NhaP-type Na+/H+ and K+/H+ antiporter
MNHCEEFLKELLALPFEQNNYNMLQSNDNQFVMLFVNEMCEYLLENMEFDVNLKRYSIQFYHKCIIKNINFHNHGLLFTYIANNINILANSENIQTVLLYLLKNVDKSRIKELFSDILNYIQSTKKLILHTLLKFEFKYKPEFEEYIKLRILALESNQEISRLSNEILTEEKQVKDSILTFNMKNFVKKNSKETIEKLCIFIKEEITPETCEDVFRMVIKAS